jgi:hypothetical protein
VQPFSNPQAVKLIQPQKEGAPIREVVLRLQGALCAMRLPPVLVPLSKYVQRLLSLLCRLNLCSDGPQYWSQQVFLTGFGSSLFDEYINKIREVEQLFARALPEGGLEPWTPHSSEGHPSIRLWNRYFTHEQYGGSEPPLVFSLDVDPLGILKNASNQGFVHLEDNRVQYMEASSREGKIT